MALNMEISTKMVLLLALVLTNFAMSMQGRRDLKDMAEVAAYQPQTFPGAYGLVFGTPSFSRFPSTRGAGLPQLGTGGVFPTTGGSGLPQLGTGGVIPSTRGAGLPQLGTGGVFPSVGGAGLPQLGTGSVPGMPHAATCARTTGSGN